MKRIDVLQIMLEDLELSRISDFAYFESGEGLYDLIDTSVKLKIMRSNIATFLQDMEQYEKDIGSSA